MLLAILLKAGSSVPTCTAGTSAIPNLSDSSTTPSPAQVGAKWDTDGDVYTREGTGSFGASDSTWQGSCGTNLYEGRWTLDLGDAPTSSAGSDGVWHAMDSIDVRVGYDTTGIESLGGDFTFELRRKIDQVIILTDTFSLDADETA